MPACYGMVALRWAKEAVIEVRTCQTRIAILPPRCYFLQDCAPIEPGRLEAGRQIVLLTKLMNDMGCVGSRIGLVTLAVSAYTKFAVGFPLSEWTYGRLPNFGEIEPPGDIQNERGRQLRRPLIIGHQLFGVTLTGTPPPRNGRPVTMLYRQAS